MNEPSLADLRDIHLPESLPMWPLAPGWWLLLALIIILILAVVGYHYWRSQAARRAALAELDQLFQGLTRGSESTTLFVGVSTLLKRVALRRFDHQQVASLYGDDWVRFLNQQGKQAVFDGQLGMALARAPYDPRAVTAGTDLEQKLFSASRQWIQWNT